MGEAGGRNHSLTSSGGAQKDSGAKAEITIPQHGSTYLYADNCPAVVDLEPTGMSSLRPGVYRHSKKGMEYRVLAIATHSETLEPMVVYEPLYDNPTSMLWVRPAAMFEELVEIDGAKVPRFVFIRER